MVSRWFMSCVSYNDCLYWITEIDGYFCKYSIRNHRAEYTCPSYNINKIEKFYSAAVYLEENGNIIGTVNGGQYLFDYSIEKNHCRLIDVGLSNDKIHAFCDVDKQGDTLYILPYLGNSIISVNIDSKEKKYITLPEDFTSRFSTVKKDRGGEIVCCSDQGSMCIYDTVRKTFIKKSIPSEVSDITFTNVKDNLFYFANASGDIYKWNSLTDELSKLYSSTNVEQDINNPYFSLIEVVDNTVWAFPSNLGDVICISDQKVRSDFNLPDDYQKESFGGMWRFTKSCRVRDQIYLSMHNSNYMLMIDSNDLKAVDVIWPDTYAEFTNIIKQNEMFDESTFALDDYIMCISDGKLEGFNNV